MKAQCLPLDLQEVTRLYYKRTFVADRAVSWEKVRWTNAVPLRYRLQERGGRLGLNQQFSGLGRSWVPNVALMPSNPESVQAMFCHPSRSREAGPQTTVIPLQPNLSLSISPMKYNSQRGNVVGTLSCINCRLWCPATKNLHKYTTSQSYGLQGTSIHTA